MLHHWMHGSQCLDGSWCSHLQESSSLTTHPAAQRHILEDQNPGLIHCDTLISKPTKILHHITILSICSFNFCQPQCEQITLSYCQQASFYLYNLYNLNVSNFTVSSTCIHVMRTKEIMYITTLLS